MIGKARRILVCVFAALVLVAAGFAGWLFLYSRDLPDISRLRDFAPTNQTVLTDVCLDSPVVAIPYHEIGRNLREAVTSAELGQNRAGLSPQVVRTLFCHSHDKELNRHLKEMRAALQLDLRYSHEDILTIYLNRVAMGDCGYGVEAAANCLFHRQVSDLTLSQAALIGGLIQSPNRYSPSRHPERALYRRNEVIDKMMSAGQISSEQAAAAKIQPLLD